MIGGEVGGVSFPEGKYYLKYRSFIEFDISGFEFPADYINSSILRFLGSGDRVDPNEEAGYTFEFQEVNSSWNEKTITWGNQPGVSGSKIVLKNPPIQGWLGAYKIYTIDIKEMVKGWINNPASNHGLRLSLTEE